jgi:hypothetical protein
LRLLDGRVSVIILVLGLGACDSRIQDPPYRSLIDGSWITGCLLERAPFQSRRVSLFFREASSVDREESYFSDSECTQQTGQVHFSGEYELVVTLEDAIYKIDLLFQSLTAQASNGQGQALLERFRYCGIDRWEPGIEQDISQQSSPGCRSFGILPIKNWNLIRVERGRSLVFGSELAHDNLRPTLVEGLQELTFVWQAIPQVP